MKLNRVNLSRALASALCVLMALPLASPAQASPQKTDAKCVIEITLPKQGDHVTDSAAVKGKAQFPAGKDLWVFVHVKGMALWWPQGAGPAVMENGKWEVLAFFGGPQDIGHDFEIGAAILEPDQTHELLRWFKNGDETGKYPGMRFPPVVQGCPVQYATVTKSK